MKIRRWMPYVDFYLAIPFISVSTEIFHWAIMTRVDVYIGLRIKVWRWEFKFGCYNPANRPQ